MINELAYAGFASPAAEEWEIFGPEVLGMQLAEAGPDGAVRLRLDDALCRLTIHPGDVDDLRYLGWGVDGPAGLAAAAETLAAAGVTVGRGDPELVRERGVTELVWFTDPFGFRHELVWGQLTAPATFRPGRPMKGFVTGEGGLGHAVLVVPDIEQAERFFGGLLGLRLSDTIDMNGITLRFYHCNSRHHSLALVELPGLVGFHHLMVETASLDDVGTALDIVRERGLPLAMTLGRHTNDLMTSFYVRTPSGFEVEYGHGGLLVDDAVPIMPRSFTSTSTWGHHFPPEPLPPGIARPFLAAEGSAAEGSAVAGLTAEESAAGAER